MQINNKVLWLLLLCAVTVSLGAQPRCLTLDSCRALALQSNTSLKISQHKQQEAVELRRVATSQFFPKATVNAAYFHNEKSVQLLSDEQQSHLSNLGTDMAANLAANMPSWVPATISGSLAELLASQLGTPLNTLASRMVESLQIDLSNVWAGGATIYQPVYMGGKLRALYQAARSYEELCGLQLTKAQDDLMLAVDEAYWRLVSVRQKLALAQQYSDLLDTLTRNVELMVDAELATQGDLAKVRVKRNEARMSLTRAQSGMALSQMALLQVCGLPFEGDYEFVDPQMLTPRSALDTIDMGDVFNRRSELRQLTLAADMADAGVKAARAMLLPNVVAQASYVVSNPSFFNGVQNKFDGMYTVGAILNFPIAHPGSIYALRAAKQRREQTLLQRQQAEEMITLQVNKLNYELRVAVAKLTQASTHVDEAEENLRLAQDSFAAGLVSSSDLLQAQTAWQQAGSELLDARIEVQMDYLYLRQALGYTIVEK